MGTNSAVNTEMLVFVAQSLGIGGHDISDLKIRGKIAEKHQVVQSSRAYWRVEVSAIIKVSCGGVLLLPLPPCTVDLRMMKEEDRVIRADIHPCHLTSNTRVNTTMLVQCQLQYSRMDKMLTYRSIF